METVNKWKLGMVVGAQALGALSAPSVEAMLTPDDGLSSLQASGYARNFTSSGGSTEKLKANRVDPRTLGVPLSYEPSSFNYAHNYPFEKLGGASRWVYLFTPRNNQIHSINSFQVSIDGTVVTKQGKTVLQTEGYELVRYPVPETAIGKDGYDIRTSTNGVLWNGKLGVTNSKVPSWVAPPPLTDAQMLWAEKRSVYVTGDPSRGIASTAAQLKASLEQLGVTTVSEDLPTAISQVMGAMARGFVYDPGVAFLSDTLASIGKFPEGKGGMNCNGTNQYLSGSLELLDPTVVSNELNGIVMGSKGEIHMMSEYGKKGWTRMIATDGVMFGRKVSNPEELITGASAGGPMLIFQEGGLSVRFTDPETGAKFRALNPAGLAFVFAGDGKRLGVSGGVKVSFANTPISDFSTIKQLVANGMESTESN